MNLLETNAAAAVSRGFRKSNPGANRAHGSERCSAYETGRTSVRKGTLPVREGPPRRHLGSLGPTRRHLRAFRGSRSFPSIRLDVVSKNGVSKPVIRVD